MSTNERLARLLFIVPYVAHRDGVPLEELADKLGVTKRQITSDIELLTMVGRPPLTPDHLIDIYVEDGVVYVDLDQSLSRPAHLTHEEAKALVLGIRLLGQQGSLGDQLERIVEKLIGLLSPSDQKMLRALAGRIGVWNDPPLAQADILQDAVDASCEIEMEYYSASSDRAKSYRVEPLAILTHSSFTYLVAIDTAADRSQKLFRLDRMGTVRRTERRFVRPEPFDLESFRRKNLYAATRNDFMAEVRFSNRVAEQVAERFDEKDYRLCDGGGLIVRVSTSSLAFLVRFVLPFGLDAEVLSPASAREAMRQFCVKGAVAYAPIE